MEMNRRPRPEWLRSTTLGAGRAAGVRRLMDGLSLHTVCREADCPNIGHCFERGTATFLVLGDTCTRSCSYCAVRKATGQLPPPDEEEPARVAEAARQLGLTHVVVTSVTRDDLPDGGAGHFARVIEAVRRERPGATIEVLTPDFGGSARSLGTVAAARPDVFNHNIETVERLFLEVRPVASYGISLHVLSAFSRLSPGTPVKSGMMLGMGETRDEIRRAMEDLRSAGASILTLGQYLSPSAAHWPVHRYIPPDEFDELGAEAMALGFAAVASSPLVRSSFHAGELLQGQGAGSDRSG